MLINSLAGSSSVFQQDLKKTDAKLQAAIASLVSGQRTQDVANIAVATQLQSQTSGLKQVLQSISQASSLTQVADGAIAQSQEIVGRLQEIAIQSSNGALSDDNRQALNEEFQNLVAELDRQVANTQFNGQNLLDGTLSGDNKLSLSGILATQEGGDSGLEIENLASTVLFGGQSLNVLSADGASRAAEVLKVAQGTLASARTNVASFSQTLDFSAANIETAILNQEAARAELSDADFLQAVTESQQAQVQRNAQLSLAAQGNRLPAALLQLVS